MSGYNDHICKILESLRKLRISQNETYRAKAYGKVIPLIRDYPKPLESGKEAKTIRGVGKSIADKIDEILSTGTLSELGDTSIDDVIKLFMTIESVGVKTAHRWYNMGYREISDIPREQCNNNQWLGITLHHDLIQRIPRDETDEFYNILSSHLSPLQIQFMICGSYRRGCTDSGDIDVLLIDQPGIDVIGETLRSGLFTHTLSHGQKKFLGVCRIRNTYRRVDLELVPNEEFPFAAAYFTGPAKFNVMMREHATTMGGRLNEQRLVDDSGNNYPVRSEEELFAILGLQYLTPEQREAYR